MNRTSDQRFRKPLLYPLSYWGATTEAKFAQGLFLSSFALTKGGSWATMHIYMKEDEEST
jgi:hypothetical protein